jgi:hypothetical protein
MAEARVQPVLDDPEVAQPRRFTPEEDAELARLVAAGTPWKAIARRLERAIPTVYNRAVRQGMHTPVPRPDAPRRRMPLPGQRRRALPRLPAR